MSIDKPSIPRGTQDFAPPVMVKRTFIIEHIREVFEHFGFLPLETPAMENLAVLTGKYGEEGDQLLFKILNSGNYLDGISGSELHPDNSKKLLFKIAEKGLRYDLTVPFARFVAMNRNDIVFPFKRYQIQPVWRADRPQKGRYREFYQCDADIVGTGSLICEAEIIVMINEIFRNLGIKDFIIKINSRKVLEGLAEVMGVAGRTAEFFTLLDKLDKIGIEKLLKEFTASGFNETFIHRLDELLRAGNGEEDNMTMLADLLDSSGKGKTGLMEINKVRDYCQKLGADLSGFRFDFTLARGLSYYTGIIMEARVTNVNIGSVGGGGRYDNLTGIFGLPGISGVGFSFGIDRIYDVMEELALFPELAGKGTRIMITNFGEDAETFAMNLLMQLRNHHINAEIYPENEKIKKQLNYANKKRIPYVLFIGSEELKKSRFTLKNMRDGRQEELTVDEIMSKLLHEN